MIDMNWQTVVTSVLGSSALTGSIAFFFRSWIGEQLKQAIQAKYAQQLETQKSELKRAGDTELERLRAALAAAAAERNTLLNALTTRRFDAIAAIHAALLKYHEAAKRLTAGFRPAGGPDENALLEAVTVSSREFNEVLTANRIFLTKVTAEKIAIIRDMLLGNSNRFMYTVSMQVLDPDRGERWMKIEQAIRGPVGNAIDDLETELRALMGDKPQPIA